MGQTHSGRTLPLRSPHLPHVMQSHVSVSVTLSSSACSKRSKLQTSCDLCEAFEAASPGSVCRGQPGGLQVVP